MQQDALEKRKALLLDFWDRLRRVTQLSLHAKSYSQHETGWSGQGKGDVVVTQEGDRVLIFHEKGSWYNGANQNISFSNVFRWTFDREAGTLSLEHLHFGPEAPVFLFYLQPAGNHLLVSVDAHLCGKDVYSAQATWDLHTIRLSWRVIGPRKNEDVEYHYINPSPK